MKITTGTLTRTILLALALINQLLTIIGYSPIPIADESLTELIATGAVIATSVLAWWKNNSFSKDAIKADEYLRS